MILQWGGSRIAGKGINLSECWGAPLTLHQMLPWTPPPPLMMMVNGHDGDADYDDDVGEDLSKRGKTRLLGHQMAPLMSL